MHTTLLTIFASLERYLMKIIFQIIGPITIKWALVRSGEMNNKNGDLSCVEPLMEPEPEFISSKNDLISPDTSGD